MTLEAGGNVWTPGVGLQHLDRSRARGRDAGSTWVLWLPLASFLLGSSQNRARFRVDYRYLYLLGLRVQN